MSEDPFTGLSNTWAERQGRDQAARQARRAAFLREVGRATVAVVATGVVAAGSGVAAGDALAVAPVRFAAGVLGGVIGGLVGIVLAVFRLGSDGVYSEATNTGAADPVRILRWLAIGGAVGCAAIAADAWPVARGTAITLPGIAGGLVAWFGTGFVRR